LIYRKENNVRRYENIVVINPDCSKEEEEELLKRITGSMEKSGAQIVRTDDWAIRKLAYPIKKKDKGHYFFFLLDMEEKSVAPISKFYRTIDQILRHMFVNVDEKSEGPKKAPDQVVFDELEGEF
jgi:small subunit ribosomal protein S6